MSITLRKLQKELAKCGIQTCFTAYPEDLARPQENTCCGSCECGWELPREAILLYLESRMKGVIREEFNWVADKATAEILLSDIARFVRELPK